MNTIPILPLAKLKDGHKYQIKLKKGRIFNRCFWKEKEQCFLRGAGIKAVIKLEHVEWVKIDTDPFDS